jgi:hypothetical protein
MAAVTEPNRGTLRHFRHTLAGDLTPSRVEYRDHV